MTRDEEEELILEALEARAEKLRNKRNGNNRTERTDKKQEKISTNNKSKYSTWIGLTIIIGLIVWVWCSLESRPQWQKDIDTKINRMSKSQILDYTAKLYLSDESSREFRYILDTWGIRCSKLAGAAACVFNSDYPDKPVGTSVSK